MTTKETIVYNAALEQLQKKGFKNAKQLASLMLAQAKHESNNFTSNLCVKYNNCFGYSFTKSSIYQTSGGSKADNGVPIGAYKSLADSAREVADWLSRRKAIFQDVITPGSYAHALKTQGYYEDTEQHYLAGIVRNYSIKA